MCTSCSSAVLPDHSLPVDVRSVFTRVASSTWVIAGVDESGPVGFTATSLVPVSIAPPLVSFNLAKTSPALPALRDNGWAAAHLLDAQQRRVARQFLRDAVTLPDDGSWRYDDRGLPELKDACARLVVSIRELFDAGESYVALADVRDGSIGSASPLLHHRGGFVPATT